MKILDNLERAALSEPIGNLKLSSVLFEQNNLRNHMATMIIRARRDIILYKNVIMLGIALHVFWVAIYLA